MTNERTNNIVAIIGAVAAAIAMILGIFNSNKLLDSQKQANKADAKQEEIHKIVNSKSDKQEQRLEEARNEIKSLQEMVRGLAEKLQPKP